MEDESRRHAIEGLRRLARLLEDHPELPAPRSVNHYPYSRAEFQRALGAAAHLSSPATPVTRELTDYHFQLSIELSCDFYYLIRDGREEKRQRETDWPAPIYAEKTVVPVVACPQCGSQTYTTQGTGTLLCEGCQHEFTEEEGRAAGAAR